MTTLSQHESHDVVRLLCLAQSGAGKTGALAALANAGLRLFILDFDNGVSVLRRYVKPEFKDNVHFVTLRDQMKLVGARVGITKASAFQRAMDLLDNGKDWGVPGIGGVSTFSPRDVLVTDTLSEMGKASLRMVMQANAAGFKAPEIQHYGTAMDNLSKYLDIITSDALHCHVIVNTHITTTEGDPRPYPAALGSKLPPDVPKFFDNMVGLSISGGVRKFKTNKDGLLMLKTAAQCKDEYPIETGFLDIFRAITGKDNLLEGLEAAA
jgi:hypothetical protein